MPPLPSLSFGSSSAAKGEQSGAFELANSGDVSIGGGLRVPKWFVYATGVIVLLAGAVLLYKWATK